MATNFQSITESPEKLAEFLNFVTFCCASGGDSYCAGCPLKGYCDDKQDLFAWLQEECE